MGLKIVGVVHVDVDGAQYSESARAGAEYYARLKGVQFSQSFISRPELEESDDCVTLQTSMTDGLPNWGYTIWLVG